MVCFGLGTVWASNADYISTQYTGSAALKTDYTRTGKRSVVGSVRDGLMSIKRFVAEQTSYAARNDELNAFLGKVQMSRPDAATRVNTAQSSSDEARRSRACQRFANVVEVDHGDKSVTKPVVLEIDSHSGTLRIEYVSDYLQRCVAISSVLSVETSLLDMAFVSTAHSSPQLLLTPLLFSLASFPDACTLPSTRSRSRCCSSFVQCPLRLSLHRRSDRCLLAALT